MEQSWLEWLAVLSYGAALLKQCIVLPEPLVGRAKALWNVCVVAGVLSQGWLLHLTIDLTTGQNLSYSNVFLLIVWLSVLILFVASLNKPLHNLALILFPLAMVALILHHYYPGDRIENTGRSLQAFLHIWLAVLSLSVLSIAALQALFVALHDRLLRSRYAGRGLALLPPMESMEALLFQLIGLGFTCLSIMLLTSFVFFSDAFRWPLLQQTLLTSLAWLVFAIILWGRLLFGWRGRIAIRWIVIGVLLLLLSYFGSAFFLKVSL